MTNAVEKAVDTKARAARPRRPHIMVIEDDLATREALAMLLKYYDFDVTIAPDGAHAVTLFPQVSPDLVVMDWRGPALSGLALCAALRRRRRELPIVVVSSLEADEDEQPVNAWLQKPIDPPLLNQVIRRELVIAH